LCANPAFFIPRQAGYPRWFAVQADQQFAGHPRHLPRQAPADLGAD
jgi:hypothetical protein